MIRMRYYLAIPLFLLAFLLQTTIFWRIPIAGYSPNILLCMVVVFSFIYQERYGLILGIAFGLLLDISTSLFLGIQAISFVVVFLIVRLFRSIFNHESMLTDMIMGVLATPLNLFIVWLLNKMMGESLSVILVLKAILPLSIMHFILVGIIHLIFIGTVIKYRRDMKFTGDF